MEERDKMIIVIIFGVIGIISIIVIISFLAWLIFRDKSKSRNSSKPSSILYQQYYPRLQQLTSIKSNNNQKLKRKKKYNTNESVLSLSFNPPHLINQNVRNLDKLISTNSALSNRSWHYGEVETNHSSTNLSSVSSYISSTSSSSSSTEIPSVPNMSTSLQMYQKLNTLHFRFLNELNLVLSSRSDSKPMHSLKHSQSCRQTNDRLPFDYYRSITPSTITVTSSINELFNYSNTTLMHKAQLARLRDDTGILY